MKRISVLSIFVFLSFCALNAQSAGDEFIQRYNNIVKRVGYCGIGVGTLLDNWEKADSTDLNMMLGRFNYYFALSERDTVICTYERKHLGEKPLLSMKDSTGGVRYYFSERLYDDAVFSQAIKAVDRAARADSKRLDIVVAKADALINYEKASPDLAVDYLLTVIDRNFIEKTKWKYPDQKVDAEFFDSVIQDFCRKFYKMSQPKTFEAFYSLSSHMLKFEKNNTMFIDNVGTYWLVARNKPKTAKKFYQKALKLDPDDQVAKTNLEIIQKQLAKGRKK